jgi:hypothetical protein
MTLIDGHNVFFALDKDSSSHFEADLNRWKDECLSLCQKNGKKFILVLDGTGGQQAYGFERPVGQHGRLIYSGSMSADDWMEQWIMRHKGETVDLVTGDKRFYDKVRFKRVNRLDPQKWWRQLQLSKTPKSKSSRVSGNAKKSFGSTDEWLEYFGESE